jgi:hypothetical protein
MSNPCLLNRRAALRSIAAYCFQNIHALRKIEYYIENDLHIHRRLEPSVMKEAIARSWEAIPPCSDRIIDEMKETVYKEYKTQHQNQSIWDIIITKSFAFRCYLNDHEYITKMAAWIRDWTGEAKRTGLLKRGLKRRVQCLLESWGFFEQMASQLDRGLDATTTTTETKKSSSEQ